MNFLDIAKQAITESSHGHKGVYDKNDQNDKTLEPLETALKGLTVELWSNSAGRLFLVADEEDAKLAMARYDARRGEVYSGSEVRCLIQIADKTTVAEIRQWKRQFDATVSEYGAAKRERIAEIESAQTTAQEGSRGSDK